MPVQVVVGTQWGDEGKGKIVDLLASDADWVARCQGGPNAGHTVVVDGESTVLHLIPSGILRAEVRCVIGAGVVIDLEAIADELDMLAAHGVATDGRLTIDAHAHVILPFHKAMEAWREEQSEHAIGTTKRGIGPAYEAKAGRRGLRMVDFLDPARLRDALGVAVTQAGPILAAMEIDVDLDECIDWARARAERLRSSIGDVSSILDAALGRGEKVLAECAQGTFLDLDHGTYPFVTSSSTTAAGVCTGLGLGPRVVSQVIGVTKAYATRVGRGPFPSELAPDEAEALRAAGGEFGATTGRPRRCGWLDLVALKRAVRLNSVDALAMTKLDVLDGREYVKVVVAYEGVAQASWYPEIVQEVARPVYESLPGWAGTTSGARDVAQLPAETRAYVDAVAEFVGVPVTIISVGSERDATVRVEPPAPAGALY